MFKLVVLSALLALACAKPSLTYSSLVAPAVYAAPTAVSHQSRVDVHSSPVIAYSGPVLKAIEVAAPAVYSAPAVYTQEVHAAPALYSTPAVYAAPAVHSVPVEHSAPAVYAAPTAVSHQSRVDVHSSPVVAYSAPVISAPVVAHSAPLVSAYSTPIVSAYHGVGELALAPNTPAVVSKANGTPLETIEVVNARNAHYTAKALQAHGIHKRSLAYSPLLAPAVYAAPTAVSHQSRVDVHSSPVIAYSAPVISAPVVSAYSHPVLSAYSSPLISAYSAHSAPLLSAYSAPLVSHAPLVSAYHGLGELALAPNTPAVVSKANGTPLETIDVVNARNAHYTAKALQAHGIHKRSIAYSSLVAPAVYAAPTAVSHQSRVDVHSSPVIAYSAPVVSAYSHPLLSAYSSPVVSAYSSPLLKSYSPLVSSYSTSVVNSHAVPAYNIHY